MVSFEHLEVCPHMMSQRNRLSLLQMGKSRHVGINILFHNGQDREQYLFHQIIQHMYFISCIKFHIKSHLVIPAPSGMQLLARLANPVDQGSLHKAVNVLVFV